MFKWVGHVWNDSVERADLSNYQMFIEAKKNWNIKSLDIFWYIIYIYISNIYIYIWYIYTYIWYIYIYIWYIYIWYIYIYIWYIYIYPPSLLSLLKSLIVWSHWLAIRPWKFHYIGTDLMKSADIVKRATIQRERNWTPSLDWFQGTSTGNNVFVVPMKYGWFLQIFP